MSDSSKIDLNRRAHDAVAARYEAEHGEIFNDAEQARLRAALSASAGLIGGAAGKTALDAGCGSGNLTSHLLELGFSVTAADVSPGFIGLVAGKFGGTGRLKTAVLNGRDLSAFKDGSFSFTAAYSVLHHVPDYLGLVREMARVTRPGGAVYIDHEPSPSSWTGSAEYSAFLDGVRRAAAPRPKPHWSRFFKLSTYVEKAKELADPRYIREGDLHVWPDDHVEWDKVEAALTEAGFEIKLREDYLLYRRGYPSELYERYKKLCSDMRFVTAVRR